MEIKNAIITSTFLGKEDHDIPTCFLTLDYGSAQQTFGGYDLRFYHEGMIQRIIETVGVSSWEQLVGKLVRVKSDRAKVYGIGHIIKELWYFPED